MNEILDVTMKRLYDILCVIINFLFIEYKLTITMIILSMITC